MRKRKLHVKSWLSLPALAAFFWVSTSASAQTTPAQNPTTTPAQNPQITPTQNNRPAQDNDINRQELANFDRFLDSHREIAEQLRKDPSLVNNQEYVKNHPALQTYLQEHPGVRGAIKDNPNAFMRQEDRFDRREGDRGINRPELANFDRFLDSHREIAEQLRRDPSLVNNQEFVKNHPALQTYLQEHPELRSEIKENPNAFMQQEARYDRSEDNRGINRPELAHFDQFLDSHREIAEQLRRDPSLVNNQEFVKNHPALQTYLQEHPELRSEVRENPNAFMQQEARYDRSEDNRGINRPELAHFDQFLDSHREIAEQLRRDPSLADNQEFIKNHPALQTYLQEHPELRAEIKENPNAFMQQEARYDRSENGMNRDADHRPFARFGEFLGSHSNIAQQLSKDPSLVKNQEYMENHPELREYLKANPDVRQGLMENPQSFVRYAQPFSNSNKTAGPELTPMTDPKPKQ